MSAPSDATRFANVETANDPAALVAFLDARTGIEGERQVKELELAMLRVGPGLQILDVGCGTGDDAREIAALLGPKGKVTGIDVSPTMIAEARDRFRIACRSNSPRAARSIFPLQAKALIACAPTAFWFICASRHGRSPRWCGSFGRADVSSCQSSTSARSSSTAAIQ
jgi:SAM-dependent methyltransferase